ncbi:TIP41-like protein [Biomphalaria glabrata]|uniref:TIP41-like protein n=2 Tax=Biomphalaria glabrata TaxID=6526 RepID=A0A9W3AQR5_BIOGL|nr:TIP41-like protein [Biomphalaria glabrata]KAI8742196.1 TIP41-like protein [Biomphalaria glabrata]KAI8752644.1 TIP41 protein [Biomphalaria glabrata]
MNTNSSSESNRKKNKDESQTFQFGPWSIRSWKSHILESEGVQREKFQQDLNLPQIPEMVFAENILRIHHESGCGIEFNALDALRLVDAFNDPIKVAASEEWQTARSNCQHIKNVVAPFDWTFTTDYKGTIFEEQPGILRVCPTTQRIDIEKLKQKEIIHFYEDVLLFEDELSDNGTSILNVKMRVMPTSFFILLRLFVRVDQVLIRMNETRFYHEAGTNFILREFTSREESTKNIPESLHTDPNAVGEHLKVKKEIFEKLEFVCT